MTWYSQKILNMYIDFEWVECSSYHYWLRVYVFLSYELFYSFIVPYKTCLFMPSKSGFDLMDDMFLSYLCWCYRTRTKTVSSNRRSVLICTRILLVQNEISSELYTIYSYMNKYDVSYAMLKNVIHKFTIATDIKRSIIYRKYTDIIVCYVYFVLTFIFNQLKVI